MVQASIGSLLAIGLVKLVDVFIYTNVYVVARAIQSFADDPVMRQVAEYANSLLQLSIILCCNISLCYNINKLAKMNKCARDSLWRGQSSFIANLMMLTTAGVH